MTALPLWIRLGVAGFIALAVLVLVAGHLASRFLLRRRTDYSAMVRDPDHAARLGRR